MKKNNETKNALFVQRLLALLLDAFLVSFAASLIVSPFLDAEKVGNIEKQVPEVMEKYLAGEIQEDQYFAEYSNLYYSLSRENGLVTIVSLLLGVCYYIVFQLYQKGQTLGKKLLKIKVVSDSGDLFMDQMIFRGLLANSLLVDIIVIASFIFSPKTYFIYISNSVVMIQYLLMIVSAFMVMFRKDGKSIHDLLTHTSVIQEK